MNTSGNPTHKPTTDMQSRQGKAPKPSTFYQDRRIQDGQLKNAENRGEFPLGKPENICTRSIIQTEQVRFRNIYAYIFSYVYNE